MIHMRMQLNSPSCFDHDLHFLQSGEGLSDQTPTARTGDKSA